MKSKPYVCKKRKMASRTSPPPKSFNVLAAKATAIRPNPAGIPTMYGMPDSLHGFSVEWSRLAATNAEINSTPRMIGESICKAREECLGQVPYLICGFLR